MSAGVPPGYRQTEVGVIPEDWNFASIEDVTIKVGSGITPRGGSRNYKEYGRPFVRSQNIGWGVLRLDDLVHIDEEVHNTFPATELKRSDVLLNITGASIGRSAVVDERIASGNVNQHVCIIRAEAKQIFADFLNYLLLSNMGQKQIDSFQAGGNREGLNFNQIRSMLFPFPPTKLEQQRIAEALSDADALIEGLGQLITKKLEVKQGVVQELLRPKHEWKAVKLGLLGAFAKGSGVRKDESLSGHLPCVRYGEIYTKHNDYIKTYYSWISSGVATTARRLETGDILFAGSGETKEEIGKCVAFIDNIEAYAGGDIVILRPRKANSTFLGYYLNTPSINRQKSGKGQGDAIVHISSNALADLDVVLPSTEEQAKIATILSDMDAEIAGLEAKLGKARRLKEGMMQDLLTGKVRLV